MGDPPGDGRWSKGGGEGEISTKRAQQVWTSRSGIKTKGGCLTFLILQRYIKQAEWASPPLHCPDGLYCASKCCYNTYLHNLSVYRRSRIKSSGHLVRTRRVRVSGHVPPGGRPRGRHRVDYTYNYPTNESPLSFHGFHKHKTHKTKPLKGFEK